MNPTFLTRSEAAEYLRISPRTLHRYTKRRLITFTQIGRRIFYRQRDLDQFLENHTVKAVDLDGGAR